MTQLLMIREYIQKFYQKYSFILNPLFRFIIGYITFYAGNKVIGYNPYLTHTYIEVILALVTVVFPSSVLLFLSAAFIVLHILYVSKYLALIVTIIFLILYFMYIKFLPKHGLVIMGMPILYALHIPYALPLFMGLIATPAAVVSIAFGIYLNYLIQTIVSVISTSTDDTINLYQQVVQQMFHNEKMYTAVVIFAVVTVVVYIMRNRKVDFAFEGAIIAGALVNTILFLIANYVLDLNMDMMSFLVGMLLSVILVWIVQFFRLSLNYARVENLQFEDEEYYYYVRAVPKNTITVKSKSVKRFNPRHMPQEPDYEVEEIKEIEEIIHDKKMEEQKEKQKKLEHDFDFTVSIEKEDFEDEDVNN